MMNSVLAMILKLPDAITEFARIIFTMVKDKYVMEVLLIARLSCIATIHLGITETELALRPKPLDKIAVIVMI